MNTRQRFTFTLRAETPIHFGGDEPGALLLDGDDQPFVSGNSLGGALRAFLNDRSGLMPADIKYYLGGEEESSDGKKEFKESRVFISDGCITMPDHCMEKTTGQVRIPVMEGTAINPRTGAARSKHKYTRYELPPGTELVFTVECDIQTDEAGQQKEIDVTDVSQAVVPFEQLTYACAAGIHRGELRFGGQKSNGYGQFLLKGLTRREFVLNSCSALDYYIFKRHVEEIEEKDCTEEALKQQEHFSSRTPVVLSLKGRFPYGVYQAYDDLDRSQITGLKRRADGKYYLPGSSIKGLLRHELHRLLIRMLLNDSRYISECESLANELLKEWFGSQDKAGSVVVANVVIDEAREMKIERFENKEKKTSATIGLPTYNRIDRITGGVIDGALKTQNEVRGDAEIRLEIRNAKDAENKLFPLIYLLRNIGSGLLPLGGRTVIGLGEFEAKATKVNVEGEADWLVFNNTDLSVDGESKLREYYEKFKAFIDGKGGAGDEDASI